MIFTCFTVCLQEAELADRDEKARMEAFRKQIIEEERQKLLREHAHRLLGYLPKVSFILEVYSGMFIKIKFHSGRIPLKYLQKVSFVGKHA